MAVREAASYVVQPKIYIFPPQCISLLAMKTVHRSGKALLDTRITAAVTEILREIGSTQIESESGKSHHQLGNIEAEFSADQICEVSIKLGATIRRQIKALIGLLIRHKPNWELAARAQRESTLAGVLKIARAIEDPKLSAELSEAAMRHLFPDGA